MRQLLILFVALTACTKDAPGKEAAPAQATAQPQNAALTAKVEAAEYTVELINPTSTGGAIAVTAKPPLHVNPEYPASFKPDPGGATFASERIALTPSVKTPCEKAEDNCHTESPLAWTGTAGQQVSGTVSFSVCMPDKCLMEKVRVGTKL